MYYYTMDASLEAETNKRALTYSTIIYAILILLAILITWPILKPTPPLVQDLIEINLGNDAEGFGEKQPHIKGEMSPSKDPSPQPQPAVASRVAAAKDIE